MVRVTASAIAKADESSALAGSYGFAPSEARGLEEMEFQLLRRLGLGSHLAYGLPVIKELRELQKQLKSAETSGVFEDTKHWD